MDMRALHRNVRTPEDGAAALFAAILLQAVEDAKKGNVEALIFLWSMEPSVAKRHSLPAPAVEVM